MAVTFKTSPRIKSDPALRVKRMKHNRCPWGCKEGAGEDMNGYCRHLAGWTRDGKTIAVRTLGVMGIRDGVEILNEVLKEEGDVVGKKDRLVKMKSDDQRVYRYPGKYPLGVQGLPDEPDVAPDPVSQEMADDAARDAEIKSLREQLAELKALVANGAHTSVPAGSGNAAPDEFSEPKGGSGKKTPAKAG